MPRSSTTYRPKWKSGRTTVVRIPLSLADKVLDYAHNLDEKRDDSSLNEPHLAYRTAADVQMTEPVNVASVPQRSPFRYPGGKTWLVPYIRSWLSSQEHQTSVLIEPFAGGGIVGLTAVFESLADHVILVERDANVAAVWNTILCGQSEWLANRILTFKLTKETVAKVLDAKPDSQRDKAFATVLRNRVQRGGIMAPGAGLVKNGENGRGLNSRWYPETLARRIMEIATVRDRISFIEGDGMEVIRRYAGDESSAFFVDPPYTLASRRLYDHWQIDHRGLFRLLQKTKGDVLLTYDNTLEVTNLAEEFDYAFKAIAMKNTHHARMTELLIGKDLSWLSASATSRGSNSQILEGRLALHQ